MLNLTFFHGRYEYDNPSAIQNVVEYMTEDGDDYQCLMTGGASMMENIEMSIENIVHSQHLFRGRSNIGKRVIHAAIILDGDESFAAETNFPIFVAFADIVSRYYFSMGFINLYSIVQGETGLAINFAINSVNMYSGRKLVCTNSLKYEHENTFRIIFYKLFHRVFSAQG